MPSTWNIDKRAARESDLLAFEIAFRRSPTPRP